MENINLIDSFAEFKEFKNIDRATLMRVWEDIFRNMLLKRMLVFSGAGEKTENRFQLGAIGIAKTLEQDASQLELFGEHVAKMAVRMAAR